MQLEELEDCEVLLCDRSEQIMADYLTVCSVLCAPVNSSTFVRNCTNCVFWVATRQLRTRDCKNCVFYLHAHTEPIIESSSELIIAPWNASYPLAKQQFEAAGFDPLKNLWNAIYDFSGTGVANWRIPGLHECEHLQVTEPGFVSENP